MANLKHSVYDTDSYFKINPITRAMINESAGKKKLIQYDHNSERFTFEIKRFVEGHDLSQCDVIQVHFCNIDTQTKERSKGVFEVTDVRVSTDSEDLVLFSWLISGQATEYVGSLNFLVSFKCLDNDSTLTYRWNTAIYTGISVSTGLDNGESVVEESTDILEQWKAQVLAEMNDGLAELDETIELAKSHANASAASALASAESLDKAQEQAQMALASASGADESYVKATEAESRAKTYADEAANSASVAGDKMINAGNHADNAEVSALAACQSASDADDFAESASVFATNSANSAEESAQSASVAKSSEIVALSAAQSALESATNGATSIIPSASGDVIIVYDCDNKPMVKFKVDGNTALDGDPTPDFPLPIHCVKAGSKIQINFKNLLPFDSVETPAGIGAIEKSFKPAIPPGQYTFRCNFTNDSNKYDRASVFFWYEGDNRATGQFKISATNHSVALTFERPVNKFTFYSTETASTNGGVTAHYTNLQIERGNRATEFTPYVEPIEISTPCDLYEGDVWYPLTGVVEHHSADIVFDGSEDENWTIGGKYITEGENAGKDYYYRLVISGNVNTANTPITCTHYPNVAVTNNRTDIGIGLTWNDIRVRWGDEIPVGNNGERAPEAWYDQISNSPITVVYPLEIPTTEQFNPELLLTRKGSVSITQNPVDISADISMDYVADTKLYIDNKFAELQALILTI